ncbi:MAG: hypothetical protein LBS62_08640 [Clostridiales bacterium]|jgi:polyhydroxyalkanoate synthesis regulator phasin|nr:hypothetical protein [Clostridiales bacterium]
MKREREKILEMVEEGKITADDAVKLLEALAKSRQGWDWNEYIDKEDVDDKLQRLSSAAKEFGDKMSAAFKDVEPKLKQTTRKVVEKTVDIVDELSRSLSDYLKNLETSEDDSCCDCKPCEDKDADSSDGKPDDTPKPN